MVIAGGHKKRDDPFTPDPKRGIHSKKMKEYVSPAPRTPLRNVVTPESGSRLANVTTGRGGEEMTSSMLMSASRSRMASTSLESLNDDEEERRIRRQDVVRTKREHKNKLLSPAPGSSPKANLPRSIKVNGTPKSHLGTPVASVIASDLASRPFPSSSANRPKLTAEQRSRMFEDWMKIAADNVQIRLYSVSL